MTEIERKDPEAKVEIVMRKTRIGIVAEAGNEIEEEVATETTAMIGTENMDGSETGIGRGADIGTEDS